MDVFNRFMPTRGISDFIVGFCGETEEDFQKTVDIGATLCFKNSFIFKVLGAAENVVPELFEGRCTSGRSSSGETSIAQCPERDLRRG